MPPRNDDSGSHATTPTALLRDSKKVPYVIPAALYVIPAKAGIQKNNGHAELVSASIEKYPEINSG